MDMKRYLPAPDLVLSDEHRRAFEVLHREAVLPADGHEIDYALPHPKWQFLQWLVDEHDVILHGSNEMAIDDFRPSRHGFDANPHGNHRAIYATNDGIWPMFFAVLDKPNYQGSMRNGVMWADADDNEVDFDARRLPEGARKWYLFSLNKDEIHKQPWREGMIYILPRGAFEQLRDLGGLLIAEWASREPVKPLAKLRVGPADFPYVDRVIGHDDTQIIRTQVLMKTLIECAREIDELSDGYRFSYPADEGRRNEAIEFGECLRGFMNAARITVTDETGGTLRLTVQGPDALKDALSNRIQTYRETRQGDNNHGEH
jgi:hypothetical protein